MGTTATGFPPRRGARVPNGSGPQASWSVVIQAPGEDEPGVQRAALAAPGTLSPAYFRVELSWAKILGVVLLLAPPARLKEWAYAGFAITLGSALIAHLSVGDGPEAWGWAAATGVLWGLSYFFWRRLQATPASA